MRKSGLLSEQWRTITEQLSAVHRKICRYRMPIFATRSAKCDVGIEYKAIQYDHIS